MFDDHFLHVDNSLLLSHVTDVMDAGVPGRSESFQNLIDFLGSPNVDLDDPPVRPLRVPHPSLGPSCPLVLVLLRRGVLAITESVP